MSVRFLAPALSAAMALFLAACAGSGPFQAGHFAQGVPALGAASNNSPALGASYAPVGPNCNPAGSTVCAAAPGTGSDLTLSNDSPALGAAFDPDRIGCKDPGSVTCPYSNDLEVILPGAREDVLVAGDYLPAPQDPMVGTKSNNSPALGSAYDPSVHACAVPGSVDCPYSNDLAVILPDGRPYADTMMTDKMPAKVGKSQFGTKDGSYPLAQSVETDDRAAYHKGGAELLQPVGRGTMVAGCDAIDTPLSSSPVSIVLLADGTGHLYCGNRLIGQIGADFFNTPVATLAANYQPRPALSDPKLTSMQKSNMVSDACAGPICPDETLVLPGADELDGLNFTTLAKGPQLTVFRQVA
ncbi:MAG: hypothetical protein O7A03_05220 [Alphaproteobacteria bacterium]|nr:hypothetical protein [Alphaproteobacteria bacterium]